MGIIARIKQMNDHARSAVQIKGHIYGPIPIRISVRQGCPMSMLLFALCLNPPIHCLEQRRTGIRISRRATTVAVVVYADISIFVTVPKDIPIIRDVIRCYERGTGAC